MDRISALNEILTDNPKDAFARYGLAMEYSKQGDFDRALAEFSILLESHPEYTAGYFMAAQTLVRSVFQVHGQLLFGIQVVVGEHIEVSLQGLRRMRLTGQLQAQGSHLRGAEVALSLYVAMALRAAQAIVGELLALQAEHRQVVQVRALAKHLACFAPASL